jgi:hypothetical protein
MPEIFPEIAYNAARSVIDDPQIRVLREFCAGITGGPRRSWK